MTILNYKGDFILDSIYKKLITIIDESKIKTNEDMSKHTSFKAGGKAMFYVKASKIEDVVNVLQIAKENKIPFIVLGNGSNILFKNDMFNGIVLKIDLNSIIIDGEKVVLDAGMKNAIVGRKLLDNSLQGFEFAAGIPGTIGGAVRMNAGAYGGEIKDIIESVTYIDYNTLQIKTINNEECNFSYRHSIFCENKNVILTATLKLIKGNKEEIKEKMDEYAKSRREKQPLEYPSAGSTFKRGKDFITAKLIDESGLKGYQIGGAQVSEKHAGFIINKDNATAQDIIALIEFVRKTVKEKTGKLIELEIEII